MRSLAVRNAAFAVRTPAAALRSTHGSTDSSVCSDAMNADLMITIAFCLYVLVVSLADGVLAAKGIRNDKVKEADAKRRAAGGEPADGSRRPRSTRLQAGKPTGVSEKKRVPPAVLLGQGETRNEAIARWRRFERGRPLGKRRGRGADFMPGTILCAVTDTDEGRQALARAAEARQSGCGCGSCSHTSPRASVLSTAPPKAARA